MTKTLVSLQELRRKLYLKSKAEKSWRFWGIYFHVYKFETLYEAYQLAKANKGVPGIDGVTFDDVEQVALSMFFERRTHGACKWSLSTVAKQSS